jgi:hypothetical protein
MVLSTDQIRKGFWYYRPEDDFPPPPVSYPEEYSGGPRLNLTCTQLNLSSHQQGKLVKTWCQILPQLRHVRYLWFNSRTNQALFEAACRMHNLEGLYIKWGGLTSLSPLSELGTLRFLHIGSSPGITDIGTLSKLGRLIVLEIENFKRISNLGPLRGLRELEGLAVEGSMWTIQVVESLEPLSHLRSLRYLFLYNLRAKDGTLKPLSQLKNLVHLGTAFWWPISEFKLLRETLPNLQYGSPLEEEFIERFGKHR